MSHAEVSSPGERDLERALNSVISQRVREHRQQLGLTVAQLAESSGISKGMLSKIENGHASPSLGTLARVAAAINVPVTSLFRVSRKSTTLCTCPPDGGSRSFGKARASATATNCSARCAAPTSGWNHCS